MSVTYLTKKHENTQHQRFVIGLMSDIHADADGANMAGFHADCRRIIDAGGRIYIFGDVFDGILPTDRKRYTRKNDQFDADDQIGQRLMHVAGILKPYVDHIDGIGMGNHETALLKFSGIDVIRLLIWELSKIRSNDLEPIKHLGYNGFITHFYRDSGNFSNRYVMYYHHGTGGSSPVTKGMINMSRMAESVEADCIIHGHLHKNWNNPGEMVKTVDLLGRPMLRKKMQIMLGGYHGQQHIVGDYMDTGYGLSYGGEKFYGTQANGCAILTLDVSRDGIRSEAVSI